MQLEGVVIGVDDLGGATADYGRLLGTAGVERPDGGRRFPLVRGTVDLVATPSVRAVRFSTTDGPTPAAFAGLAVRIDPAGADGAAPSTTVAIDHVVVNSTDAARAVALWRDEVGLRLALDREFPNRGLRLLFFRSNHMTLEYATPLPASTEPPGDDHVYGVSYRVSDLAAHRERLIAAGVDVSELRTGMKPGTTVCTVRSHTAGVPTLLLGAADA